MRKYHLVGAAKTGYNLHRFMQKQGIETQLYAADSDYAAGKEMVNSIDEFLSLNVEPSQIIITSETAFNLLEQKYSSSFKNHYYLRDKLNLSVIASAIGVRCIPNLKLDDTLEFPIAIKPKCSMDGKVPFKFQVIHSYDDLDRHRNLVNDCLIQPYFDDSYKEYTIGGYFDGRSNSLISTEELNYYPKGISAFVQNRTLENIKVIEKVSSYLNAISYSGFIELEFKVNNDDWYIMDINPRPWGYFYYYLDGLKNFKQVILDDAPVQLDMKNQWVNMPRLVLANLQRRFINPALIDLVNGKTCFEPLFD